MLLGIQLWPLRIKRFQWVRMLIGIEPKRRIKVSVEWDDLIRDLDRPQEVTIENVDDGAKAREFAGIRLRPPTTFRTGHLGSRIRLLRVSFAILRPSG